MTVEESYRESGPVETALLLGIVGILLIIVFANAITDPDPTDDTTLVGLTASPCGLSLSLTLDDTNPGLSTETQATVTVTNTGPCDADDVEITGLALPCTTALTGNPTPIVNGTAALGTIPTGTSTNLTAIGTVADLGPCSSDLTVTTSTPEHDLSDNTATLTLEPAICDDDPTLFTDVSATSYALFDIACIYALGIATGTTATTYDPSAFTTREQMATFLARLYRVLGRTCPTEPIPFTDVSVTSFALFDIVCIYELGITTGTSPTTYSPDAFTTREQMAAVLARLYRVFNGVCPTAATPFTDVAQTSFAFNDIACIYGLDITTGTTATTYDPSAFTTREQMATFLARLYRPLAT